MKLLWLFSLCTLLGSGAFAQAVFPGLQKIMTEAEWKRAGLDRLTPDEIGVIDAALIRHVLSTSSTTASATAPASPTMPATEITPAQNAATKSRIWEKFGLGKSDGPDWRTQPPMVAKVTGMRGANGFVLDNGQVWEGQELIPFEILGQSVTIEARPMGAFALKLNGDSLPVRVRRVR
jgi:hypothetical protein